MSLLKQNPVINLLHTPRLAADKQDHPAVHELVENIPRDVKIEQASIGQGSLTLPVCRGEELSDLAPVRCGKGVRASMAYVVDDLENAEGLEKVILRSGVIVCLFFGLQALNLTDLAPLVSNNPSSEIQLRSGKEMAMANRVADLLVDVLLEAGVQRIYGVPGDSLDGITDSIRARENVHCP